jgi:hypothetical protein
MNVRNSYLPKASDITFDIPGHSLIFKHNVSPQLKVNLSASIATYQNVVVASISDSCWVAQVSVCP